MKSLTQAREQVQLFHSPFPTHVCFGVEHSSTQGQNQPHTDELVALSNRATPRRKRSFVLGRLAAKRALEGLLQNPPPVLPGHDRAPRWPKGIVGSITHTAEWGLAAADYRSRTRALGIDLAHLSELPGMEIASLVADADEQQWIAGNSRRLLALFSAKESVFKALYPECLVYFGFHAVTTRWSETPTLGFEVHLLRQLSPIWPSGANLRVSVRWYDGFVLTSVRLPTETQSREIM